MAFADNPATLPGVSHLAALNLIDAADAVVATIEQARPGRLAGGLTTTSPGSAARSFRAAKKGWKYAEHRGCPRQPGKHPNIDRLIGLIERETLRVKQVFAV